MRNIITGFLLLLCTSAFAQKFPSGIKALVDYVHSKGLKFGLYSDAAGRHAAGNRGAVVMSIRTP
jgi:hypothetical protein